MKYRVLAPAALALALATSLASSQQPVTQLGRGGVQRTPAPTPVPTFTAGPIVVAPLVLQTNAILADDRLKNGYVLTHEHPAVAKAFGGQYAFRPAGNYIESQGILQNGYATCGGCAVSGACNHGVKGALGPSALLGTIGVNTLGSDMKSHLPLGRPKHDSFSHLRYATDWIKAAVSPTDTAMSGQPRMKIMVAYAVENETMCEQIGATGCPQGDSFSSMVAQIDAIKAWVTANAAWAEVALSSADALRIVRANKLAVVLGVEAEHAFGSERSNVDPVARLNQYHARGVRTFYLAHKLNSRLAGADVYHPKAERGGRAIRLSQAISGCFYVDDTTGFGPFPLQKGNHQYCRDGCGPNMFKGRGVTDQCRSRFGDISEVNLLSYLDDAEDEFNGFKVYPLPNTFQTAGVAGNSDLSGGGRTTMTAAPNPGQLAIERNKLGLSTMGLAVVREAMRKGMLVNIDHVSSRARIAMRTIANQEFGGYPLNAFHNNPNSLLEGTHNDTAYGSEYDFDDEELTIVKNTGGFFGVRLGPIKTKRFPAKATVWGPVATRSCPKTSTENARVLAYLVDKGIPVGYSLDFATITQGTHSRTMESCAFATNDRIKRYRDPSRNIDKETDGLDHIGMMQYFHDELASAGLAESYVTKLKNDGVGKFIVTWLTSEVKGAATSN